jgi:uncharacterized protein (DUF2384 family)
MTNDENVSPQAFDALRARFQEQSRKAQAYYTVMHKAREITGSDDAASVWMENPLSQFDGRTPAQLVSENRVQEVLDYISTL